MDLHYLFERAMDIEQGIVEGMRAAKAGKPLLALGGSPYANGYYVGFNSKKRAITDKREQTETVESTLN